MSISSKVEFLCRAADVCGNRLRVLLGTVVTINDKGQEKDKEVFASVSLPDADYIRDAEEYLGILASMPDTEATADGVKPVLLRVSVPKDNSGNLRLSLSPRMTPKTVCVAFSFLGGFALPDAIEKEFALSVLHKGGASKEQAAAFVATVN